MTVFVDAVLNRDADVVKWYKDVWVKKIDGMCDLKIRCRKRLSSPTQKMGIVDSLNFCKETYDYTVLTRNNMIWQMPIPFSESAIADNISMLSFNLPDFTTTRNERHKGRGMWHDYMRVEDKYIIVPNSRLEDIKEWLRRPSLQGFFV